MRWLSHIIASLMALILFPVHGNRLFDNQNSSSTDADNGQPLKCAIQLSEGFLPGQNYDLLKAFSLSQRDSTEIFLAEPQARYLDSLRLDSLDILVLPASEYKDTSGVTAMILGDTSVVWVIKADQKRSKELVKWFVTYRGSAEYSNLIRRFTKCYGAPGSQWEARSGIISPYDDLLKANAKSIGWDWKLLAAVAWSESKFKIQVESPRGALGIMQMMPVTAGRFGVSNVLDPEENISAGARYLGFLQKMLSAYTEDPEALRMLTIAAYNCGGGRALQDLEGRERSSATEAYVKAVLFHYDVFSGRLREENELLSPDGLGGVNPGDEEARDEKKEHDDHEGEDISDEHHRDVDVDGNKGDEIILGV